MANEKYTKADIIESIYTDLGFSKNTIHSILDRFFEEVKTALAEDKVVELRGFGTFEIKTRKGRDQARNPKTGDIVQVNDHGVAHFRPGKELKEIAWPLRK